MRHRVGMRHVGWGSTLATAATRANNTAHLGVVCYRKSERLKSREIVSGQRPGLVGARPKYRGRRRVVLVVVASFIKYVLA